jgi:hypothetical protein
LTWGRKPPQFCWKEIHEGMELIVHRKGAAPTGNDMLSIIPGSGATPEFIASVKGESAPLLNGQIFNVVFPSQYI